MLGAVSVRLAGMHYTGSSQRSELTCVGFAEPGSRLPPSSGESGMRPLTSPGYDYRRKNFPPYLTRQGSLLSGFILGPVGPFRYPPLRCRGKALAGAGVQVR